MKGLIRASLANPFAVLVMCFAIVLLGVLALSSVPVDILPVFKSPAVQVLTFYTGMPAKGMEKDITVRMERWTGQASGMRRQESRSGIGFSVVRNFFQPNVDANGALTEVNSLALADVPNLPPGTLPPVVLRFDPTSNTPVCLVALNSKKEGESTLYDLARYEARNFIMQQPGANAPVVIGGKIRAVMLYLDPTKMQAHNLSPDEVMRAVSKYNLFFPSGDVKIGRWDYALSSNSMFDLVERFKEIPISLGEGRYIFLSDVATPKDSSFIQTNIVRVDGRKQVYIPIYRQLGSSTLAVVDRLKDSLPDIKDKLTKKDVNLELVMDQSVYVRASISALLQEGITGAILCSLVILLFLGEWRMTFIAILTLPLSVLVAIICLNAFGQTINVMTLAGLTLAIGPMIDSAIICLENTHRHLVLGRPAGEAALQGASEVAMPELVSTLCTFLVLSPLALMPGMGRFLFLPMALAVFFAMTTAYLLSRTLVPCFSAYLLAGHDHAHAKARVPAWLFLPALVVAVLGLGTAALAAWTPSNGGMVGLFLAMPAWLQTGVTWTGALGGITVLASLLLWISPWFERFFAAFTDSYIRVLDAMLRRKGQTVAIAFLLLAIVLIGMWPIMRQNFFPEVDSGAFEIAVRAPPGTRIEITEDKVAQVEDFIRHIIPKDEPRRDLKLIVSEIGVTADWSAAYTPNSGPQDAVIKVQLTRERSKSAQEYIRILREGLRNDKRFKDLEFSFDSGGLVRGALNEGKSSPINIQLVGKNQKVLFGLADQIKEAVAKVDGVVDARVIQKPNAPELVVNVNRDEAVNSGLNQDDIMRSVIAAVNSSITYNKTNFWIDEKNGMQYYVGVQYPEKLLQTMEDILNIPINSPRKKTAIPLKNFATLEERKVPTEVHHVNLQPTVDLTMNVQGRDLGHVSEDVARELNRFGVNNGDGSWAPYDPASKGKHTTLKGSKTYLAGEYSRMKNTFWRLFLYGGVAVALIYFLMVALDRSFVVPLTVMAIVPLCMIGILPMLWLTGSAINVQSLLGFIFIVGIKVANTVLMTDYAQELRRHEGLSPLQAIRKAASLRVRPVTMTALAAFFAMLPTALALERGSEANAPLARAILGGLLAGEPATLFVLPCLYALLVRDRNGPSGHVNNGDHPPQESDDLPVSQDHSEGQTPGISRAAPEGFMPLEGR
jgi:multidrug efflux pump subunit AcrB